MKQRTNLQQVRTLRCAGLSCAAAPALAHAVGRRWAAIPPTPVRMPPSPVPRPSCSEMPTPTLLFASLSLPPPLQPKINKILKVLEERLLVKSEKSVQNASRKVGRGRDPSLYADGI